MKDLRKMKMQAAALSAVLFVCLAGCVGGTEGPAAKPPSDDTDGPETPEACIPVDAVLAWSDEFDGNSLDLSKWGYQIGIRDSYSASQGPKYWGNNEQQYYTEEAVSVSDGVLRITAIREEMPEGRNYSSARIVTRDKFSFTYGYTEARMQLPAEEGMWPAFWALPQPQTPDSTANDYGGWAASGEIDIMEAKGRLPDRVGTTLHYGRRGQSTYDTLDTVLEEDITAWHTYGFEWRAEYIAFYIDGQEVHRVTSEKWWTEAASKEENAAAPFDKPFYLLLNLAVGGNFDGGREPREDFFSADMVVDYVRVYRFSEDN